MSNKMYNESIKDMYLSQYDNEGTILTTKYLFFNSHIIEESLEKDLYDFTLAEIGQVVANTNPKSKKVALDKRNSISNYISWAIDNDFRKDNIHPLKGVEEDWSNQFVDTTIKQFISKQDLDKIVGELVNYQDRVVPVLIFNGVYGHQCSELRNLRMSDIHEDGLTVTLKDDIKGERDIKLDEDVIDLIRLANIETEYYNKNGTSEGRNATSEISDTEYVIRASKRGSASTNDRISQITIINRIKMISEFFDIPELTPKSIQRSGMLYMAYKLNNDVDKFDEIGDRFNWSKVTNNGYEYYNTSYFRNFINEENIEYLYSTKS